MFAQCYTELELALHHVIFGKCTLLTKHRLRWLLGLPVRLYYRERTIQVPGEAGIALRFKPAEAPRLLRGPRNLEPETRERWSALLRPGASIIDAGAHIGITTQRFYGILNGDCTIWSCEPNPRTFQLLKENTYELGSAIKLFPYAIGDEDKEVTFVDNLRHGALSRLDSLRVGNRANTGYWDSANELTVPMRRLDTLLDENPDFCPTFIKIDVEGAGDLLMDGAKKLFREYKPTCFAEYHTQREQEAICGGLLDSGYRGVAFDDQGKPAWSGSNNVTSYFVHPDSAIAAEL